MIDSAPSGSREWQLLSAPEKLGRVGSRVRTCVRCALSETRTNAVPGSGPGSARVMIIGEAPGQNEDLRGEPFVGQAGKLLDTLLAGIGLDRTTVFITNVVKCRPPGNRDPLPEEVQACSRYLDAQMEAIGPRVVVILGRQALMRILPDHGPISRVHGQPVERDGMVYIPVYHPAAALHNPLLRSDLEADFESVRRLLGEEDSKSEEPVLKDEVEPAQQMDLI